MKLVHIKTQLEAKVNDALVMDGEDYILTYMPPPHKASSTGKVCACMKGDQDEQSVEYYAESWGLEWIEREDRGWRPDGDKPKSNGHDKGKVNAERMLKNVERLMNMLGVPMLTEQDIIDKFGADMLEPPKNQAEFNEKMDKLFDVFKHDRTESPENVHDNIMKTLDEIFKVRKPRMKTEFIKQNADGSYPEIMEAATYPLPAIAERMMVLLREKGISYTCATGETGCDDWKIEAVNLKTKERFMITTRTTIGELTWLA